MPENRLRVSNVSSDSDIIMDCSHEDMACFPSTADKRFLDFIATVKETTETVDKDKEFNFHRKLIQTSEGSRPPTPPTPPRSSSSSPEPSEPSESSELSTVAAEDELDRCQGFLRSLHGWSEVNTGHHLEVAPGTCEWHVDNYELKAWKVGNVREGTMIFQGRAGQGKTHLAKAISNHFQKEDPSAVVLSFFCTSNDKRPAIWEYFTWALIHRSPAAHTAIPQQYLLRDEESGLLSLSAFSQIWTALRDTISQQPTYLIIDGPEVCGEEFFQEFISALGTLQRKHMYQTEPPEPSPLKVLLMCRATPAVEQACQSLTYSTVPEDMASQDISDYTDARLHRLLRERTDVEPQWSQSTIDYIKTASKGFWPFAIYAIETIENSFLSNQQHLIIMDTREHMPEGMQRWIESREVIRSSLLSVNNDWRTRAIATFIASNSEDSLFNYKVMRDILRGLGPKDEVNAFDFPKYLKGKWSEMLYTREVLYSHEGCFYFVHRSVRHYVRNLLTRQQRHLNMAFMCLHYLLRDSFKNRLPLSQSDREASRQQVLAEYPFYQYAASEWGCHLRDSGDLALEILPLLQRFLDLSCSQFKTWCDWRDWSMEDASDPDPLQDPLIIVLVQMGCVEILRALLSAPPDRRALPWGLAARSLLRREALDGKIILGSLIPNDWTVVTNSVGESLLTISIISKQTETTKFILEQDPDVNARSRAGVTPLWAMFHPLDGKHDPVDEDLLEELLQRGADPNTCDSVDGMTPLHAASRDGDAAAVRMLLSYGALVDVANIQGVSPLESAWAHDHPDVFRELVGAGADVDTWWTNGQSPLAACIASAQLDIFNILLPLADVNQMGRDRMAPIHKAIAEYESAGVKSFRLEFLQLLVSRPDLDLDLVEQSWGSRQKGRGENALATAILDGNSAAVGILLARGADPRRFPGMAATPLCYAAEYGQLEVAELLLAHHSPLNDFGRILPYGTALEAAVRNGWPDIVAALLEQGADATVDDALGSGGLLRIALETDEPEKEMIEMLLKSRPPPAMDSTMEGDDNTNEDHPLHLAVASGDVDLLRLLLEHGAELGRWLEPASYHSPLHEAATQGFEEMCELLLRYEPRLVNAQCAEGIQFGSPLHFACTSGSADVVSFLLEKGAKADQPSFHLNATPLMIACQEGDYDIVRILLEAAPLTVNVPLIDGTTPIYYATSGCDSRILEALLIAGADMSHRNTLGVSAITGGAFDCTTTEKNRELLLAYGMDVNSVGSAAGHTALGTAITDGAPKHVKWLLENGADPLRCRRLPHEPVIWQNALQVALCNPCDEVVDLLLEPQWGLLDHVGDVDPFLGSTLFNGASNREVVPLYGKIFQACESRRQETGEDPMAKVMHQRNFNGWTPLDLALGRTGRATHALPQCAALIIRLIDHFLSLEYQKSLHEELVCEIASNLILQGGYEQEAIALLTHYFSVPVLDREAGVARIVASSCSYCSVCDENVYESFMICRYCGNVRCETCADVLDFLHQHEHEWLAIPLELDADWAPTKHQDMLERVQSELRGAYPEAKLPDAWDNIQDYGQPPSKDAKPASGNESGGNPETAIATEEKAHEGTANIMTSKEGPSDEQSTRKGHEPAAESVNGQEVPVQGEESYIQDEDSGQWEDVEEDDDEEDDVEEEDIQEGDVQEEDVQEDDFPKQAVATEPAETVTLGEAIPEKPAQEQDMQGQDTQGQDTQGQASEKAADVVIAPGEVSPAEIDDRQTLETSLQLATLHAFNLLEIRRPLFTPYLPLCRTVEKAIEAWMPMIKEQRRLVERRNLELEMYPDRLWVESMYVSRGLRQRYLDEKDVQTGLILQDLRYCFEMQHSDEEGNPEAET